uniref:Uncharacterized protein n=1 Tax=Romanomermis culicivorax TaxID=13658 RepID=A0A915HZ09_ROMCU
MILNLTSGHSGHLINDEEAATNFRSLIIAALLVNDVDAEDKSSQVAMLILLKFNSPNLYHSFM